MEYEVTNIDGEGRLHIPRSLRKLLGCEKGGAVVVLRDGDTLRIVTPGAAIEHAKRLGEAARVVREEREAREAAAEAADDD